MRTYRRSLTAEGCHRRGNWGALATASATLLALLLFALAPTVSLAETGSISGRVTDAVTDEAIKGLEVCVYAIEYAEDEAEGEELGCTETRAGGSYTMANLTPLEFEVEFNPSGVEYVTQFYDGKQKWWEADPVSVVGGANVKGIDAELSKAAASKRKKHCKRGFRKRRVNGRVRCVRKRTHKSNLRAAGSPRLAIPVISLGRLGG